ncbi:MAG TPA: hypothetical protein VFA87_02270 [Rhizomicrobium sp.]|nr:hypothetical protein [Rhizomicrobium sp.]
MTDRALSRFRRSRISLRRGLIALIAAVGTAVLCLSLAIELVVNLGLEGGCGCVTPSLVSQALMLLESAGAVAAIAIPLAFATWQCLGLVGREGALAYSLAGLIEGLACAAVMALMFTGSIQPRHPQAFLVLGTLGAGIEWAFWRFARMGAG